MAKTFNLTDAARREYDHLFALAKIRPERAYEVSAAVQKIIAPANWARYEAVEAATRVPAHVVGIIHNMESSLSFAGHLHNGDPLSARTRQVPKGHLKTGAPPFEWTESAVDALKLKRLDGWDDWSIPGIAYVLERYNGVGYQLYHPHVKSPYLWSFTTIYSAGKYVADGKWSDTAVSKQCGGLALLKRLIEIGRVDLAAAAMEPDEGSAATTPHLSESAGITSAPAAPPPYPGRLLRTGSTGPDVETVQRRLLAIGINEGGSVDSDFGEKTEWAVRLFQARSEDEAGEPLEVDGVVGRKTWRALFGINAPIDAGVSAAPAAGSLLDAVLAIAGSQVGERERPLGSNRGPMVDRYLSSVAPSLLGQPWCMAFVHWCFMQAASDLGIANPAPKTASVLRSWEMAQGLATARIVTAAEARRDPDEVVPGMVFYISTGGRTGHTGFVADVVGGRLVTIEGNTNDGGSREGIGVFTRTRRRIDSINIGFIAFGR